MKLNVKDVRKMFPYHLAFGTVVFVLIAFVVSVMRKWIIEMTHHSKKKK